MPTWKRDLTASRPRTTAATPTTLTISATSSLHTTTDHRPDTYDLDLPSDQPLHTTDHPLDPINHGPPLSNQPPQSPPHLPPSLPLPLNDTHLELLDSKGPRHRVVNLILCKGGHRSGRSTAHLLRSSRDRRSYSDRACQTPVSGLEDDRNPEGSSEAVKVTFLAQTLPKLTTINRREYSVNFYVAEVLLFYRCHRLGHLMRECKAKQGHVLHVAAQATTPLNAEPTNAGASTVVGSILLPNLGVEPERNGPWPVVSGPRLTCLAQWLSCQQRSWWEPQGI